MLHITRYFFFSLLVCVTLLTIHASPFIEEKGECMIKVETIVEIKGKCVRLRGGKTACQSDRYIDIINESCSEENFD